MLDTYYNSQQLLLLGSSLLFYCFSIFLFSFKEKKSLSIALLIIGAFLLGIFSISLDPYLNMWDEQFHGLVAKNLSNDLFKPVLYPDPVLPFDKSNWTENYIWVHKQPLFLWQMAVSIKLFGVTPFAIRLPSVLCFTFASFCTYRIGINMVNRSVGYLAALLFSSNYFFIELISGSTPTDHNDVVFISYVTGSIWAFSEHIVSPEKKRWIYLAGVFTGAALLTKWLPGLLVFAGWFIYIVCEKGWRFISLSNYKNFLVSLLIAMAIFLPWQLYSWSSYSVETSLEYNLNALHFKTALEGHSGNNWFYYDSLNRNLGYLFTLFCFAGLILLKRYIKTTSVYITFLSLIVLVFIFFTAAATKMEAFPLIVSSLLFISVAVLFYNLSQISKRIILSKLYFLFIAVIGLFVNLNPEKLQAKHTSWKSDYNDYYDRLKRTEWKNTCEELTRQLGDHKYVVFNCPEVYENISLMFYTNYIGYMGLPDPTEMTVVQKKGYKTAVIDDGMLPDSLINNKNILVVSMPPYKAIRTDTVYIKSKNFNYLFITDEGRVMCNDPSRKTQFVIRYFSDGSCFIRDDKAMLASVSFFNWPGLIVFDKKQYSISERFKMEPIERGLYKIKTEDNTTLKVVNNGTALCADDRPELTEDQFEIHSDK